MRLGIIILFQGECRTIDNEYVNKLRTCSKGLEICLVNVNDSCESFSGYFQDVQNLSIVNLRKFKSIAAAVRAGARYLYSRSQWEHLGYIECPNFEEILEVISRINNNRDAIIKWDEEAQKESDRRLTQFQRLFALSKFFRSVHVAHSSS